MKFLVTYKSVTGNTKKIAEAIYGELPDDKEFKPIDEVDSIDHDFAFIGFPINASKPVKDAADFIKEKANGKKVAIFVTHSTPMGAPPLEGILNACKEVTVGSELLGFFDCQGEFPESLVKFGEQFKKMREATMGLPNESDIQKAREFAKNVLSKLNN